MKKIEIKHLAPYLPYGLKIKCLNFPIGDGIRTFELDCGHDIHFYLANNYVRPILRPMCDLHKPIQDNGNWTIPANYLYRRFDVTDMEFNGNIIDPKHGYDVYMFLISHHFDVFGLIEQDLAIDINTL